ncbi:hypothetical protein PNA2_1544 [Pyrococcus sp. NA2]|uniref:hypothetical protein n=1 Tax=Pyrococcus sp. (strain NA2) TaxID=342949 RepID=UPI000209B088|nr:hypothetical protein [Pyrococcus sp. NA2]AEC52459.1 hypothetical protein PNA2_1544 [Pyrococcus sp. NA2]
MSIRDEYKKFKVSSGERKISAAREILNELIKLAGEGHYWEIVEKELGIKEGEAKEVLLFLEEMGEIRIRKAKNGRRLYVLTLKLLKRNPVTLDRWVNIHT